MKKKTVGNSHTGLCLSVKHSENLRSWVTNWGRGCKLLTSMPAGGRNFPQAAEASTRTLRQNRQFLRW